MKKRINQSKESVDRELSNKNSELIDKKEISFDRYK